MNIYINKIRDILVDLMPKHWYKIYLYFECSELGSTSMGPNEPMAIPANWSS